MSSLIIRGATVDKTESYCTNGGIVTTEIHIKAAWSEPVCETMGWTKEPQGFGNGSLDGQLAGVSMILEPNGKELKDYRFDIKIDSVGKFKHVAKEEDGEVVDRGLKFIVTTSDEEAHLVLDKWLRMVGPSASKAQCRITYSAEEQMPLVAVDLTDLAEANKPRGRKRTTEEVQEAP